MKRSSSIRSSCSATRSSSPPTSCAWARFGEPCYYPFVTGIDGYPFIFEVVKEETRRSTSAATGIRTDVLPQPPLATLLYALETPTHGGDTLFANTHGGYDALSEECALDKLVGVNSAQASR